MRVLITGGSSLLGKALISTQPTEAEVWSTWYTNYVGQPMYHMDVCNQSQVNYVFHQVRPDVVIHCAAIGSVDYAEKNESTAREVNFGGTVIVRSAAQEHQAKFVYISTNAVFDGENPPYNEQSFRRPANRYGLIKLETEDLVMSGLNWLIIRPYLLYGWTYTNARQNWALTINKLLRSGKPLRLVNDVYWQPTYAPDCARAIWRLLDYKEEIFHVATDDRMTLYEFGQAVGRAWAYKPAQIEKGLLPVSADEFKGMAPRPKDTTYDLSKIHGLDIRLQSVKDGLREMMR